MAHVEHAVWNGRGGGPDGGCFYRHQKLFVNPLTGYKEFERVVQPHTSTTYTPAPQIYGQIPKMHTNTSI